MSHRLTTIEGRGRAMVAEKDIPAGAVIFTEEPYCLVVSAGFRDTHCSFCCQSPSDGNIFATGPDDPLRYCSVDCIAHDQTSHAPELLPLRSMQAPETIDMIGSDPIRLIVRLASMKIAESKQSLSVPVSTASEIGIDFPVEGRRNRYRQVMLLESINSHVGEESQEEIQQVTQALSTLIRDSELDMTEEDVNRAIYMIQSNAHRIVNDAVPVALGLFPLTSMINHSCVPNCNHYFQFEKGRPPKLVMRAIRSITSGEELLYSYVTLYDSTSSRRQKLYATYGFYCRCERCIRNDDEELESVCDASRNIQVEISTCTDLISAGAQGNFEGFQRLLRLVMNTQSGAEDEAHAVCLSVCSKYLLNVYILINRAGLASLELSEKSIDNEYICVVSVFFGLLASGLILHFTKCPSIELVFVLQVLGQTLQRGAATLPGDPLSIVTYIKEIKKRFIFCEDPLTVTSIAELLEMASENGSSSVTSQEPITAYKLIASYALNTLKGCYGLSDSRITAQILLNLLKN